jgi:hypothetical protein
MRPARNSDLNEALAAFTAPHANPAELDAKLERAAALRASPEASRELDRGLFDGYQRLFRHFNQARSDQQELRGLLDKMAAPPWHPGLVLGSVEVGATQRVLVYVGTATRVVEIAPEVDGASLGCGVPVFLSSEQNLVIARDPRPLRGAGETARFERVTDDGRVALRARDEEWLVDAVADLDLATLRPGDRVRWHRAAGLAIERCEQSEAAPFLIDEVPDLSLAAVGGDGRTVTRLLDVLSGSLLEPARAQRYGLDGRNSVLLEGPPGTGKTLITRVVAAEIGRRSGKRCRLAVVNPGAWESPWVGETEANMRAVFRTLREAAEPDGLAILFFDEVESVARARGGMASQIHDKFLGALLAELDGFGRRGNIAVVAATNRKDLLDPAFRSRMADEITVGRPDRREARGIFGVHLAETLPFAVGTTRTAMIEAALTRLYAPNAEAPLCQLQFRDGTRRAVFARELLSGRLIERICVRARELAFAAEATREEAAGICEDDLLCAVEEAVQRLATTLSARNARSHLMELPEDLDVVRVEPTPRPVTRSHRYVQAA